MVENTNLESNIESKDTNGMSNNIENMEVINMSNSIENNKETNNMDNSTENKEVNIMSNNTENNMVTNNMTNCNENMKTDTTDSSTDNTNMEIASSFGNLSEIIPKDEQGLTDMDIINGHKITAQELVEPCGDIVSEIPDDERAVTKKPTVDMTAIEKCGCFAPTHGMKGFITSTNHIFYAKIYRDAKGKQSILYCQQYRNKEFSGIMKISQADLMIAAECSFIPKRISEATLKNKVNRFITEAKEDYYNKTAFPKEALNILSILNLLIDVYDKLPVDYITQILNNPSKLYQKVVEVIETKWPKIFDDHKAYYALPRDYMETLAEELNLKTSQLSKKLAEYRFLYLTESSDGYQTCVRYNSSSHEEFFSKSHTEWCYCILKLGYLAKKKMQNKNAE